MTKLYSIALTVGATAALLLATASDANAWFGRSNGSCGSHGGSYSSNGSNGGFGGIFSRRGHGHNNQCVTESHSSCGSHGGAYNGVQYEEHRNASEPSGPPPAPADPGGARQDGGASALIPPPTAIADRKARSALLASNRQFGVLYR